MASATSTSCAAAEVVARTLGAARHVVAQIDLREFGGSALTADIAVPKGRSADEMADGIPITYVPARNTVFLSFALAWAETLGASDIFIGVNALDYSGYPDCRPEYIAAFEAMANLATKAGVEGTQRLKIHAPLMPMSKAQIVQRRPAAGRRLRADQQLLRPRCADGQPCGELRLLSAARQGLCRSRCGRSAAPTLWHDMKPVARTLTTASAGFEAARHVDLLPQGHRSRRLHGHSFLAHLRCALPAGWAPFAGGEVRQLRELLQARVARLDYQLLNELVQHPTDENLARWVRDRLDLPGIEQIGIQSTQDEGVDLDPQGQAHVWRRYRFQAAHQLPNVPAGHKCGRMHGHGFEVILHAQQKLGSGDMGIDYDHIDAVWAPLDRQLNHACLNELPGLHNPTSEMLSSWLWQRLRPQLPELSWITVYETASCGANFDGRQYRIWKDFTLDSALQLKHAPQGHALRRIHGHTYTLRLHLCAPLDQVLGWTIDFGDVKQIFNPIFQALDHQPLHEIADLADCDTASIAHWILNKARAQLPQLDRVDLFETRGCGAIVSVGGEGPALPV